MGQYDAVVRWARWAEDAIDEWSGVTPETGATVPPYAFTSGWPAQDAEHTAKRRNPTSSSGSSAR
jgi:hypothetical protein